MSLLYREGGVTKTVLTEDATVSVGTGLTGGGSLDSDLVVSHSPQSVSLTTGPTSYLERVTLDQNGHVTSAVTSNLASYYLTTSGFESATQWGGRFHSTTDGDQTITLSPQMPTTLYIWVSSGEFYVATKTLSSVVVNRADYVDGEPICSWMAIYGL